jgi:hypothetical protein
MRLRLGLLQDQAAIERQIAKEAAEHKAKTARKAAEAEIPTVRTKAQAEAAEAAEKAEKENPSAPPAKRKPKIRPLSEAKAIDSGANFISEGFLFSVGLGLIVFETARSRRKENKRRDDVAERIAELEAREGVLTERLESVDEARRALKREKARGWFGTGKSGEEKARVSIKEEVEKRLKEVREAEEREAEAGRAVRVQPTGARNGALRSVVEQHADEAKPAEPLAAGTSKLSASGAAAHGDGKEH